MRCQIRDTEQMSLQVLIEAVENHMPQVIVIDEIGTKLEALAASTIAQRGIQLVATAHGVTIENLVMNPSLETLVGGIQVIVISFLFFLKKTTMFVFDYVQCASSGCLFISFVIVCY